MSECDDCQKKKTIHLTEIIDGQMAELHLCEDCPKLHSEEMNDHFGLSDLISGLTDFDPTMKTKAKAKLACSFCDLTFDDFKKHGRLGCAHCYEAFQESLDILLKKIHGSSKHTGRKPIPSAAKVKKTSSKAAVAEAEPKAPSKPKAKSKPKKPTKKEVLAQLKEELRVAIEEENFEQAAALRDKIRELS